MTDLHGDRSVSENSRRPARMFRNVTLGLVLVFAAGSLTTAQAADWYNPFGFGGEPERPADYNQPHAGIPGTFHSGYPHYEAKQPYYGIWYRPRAFGLQANERCAPDYWNPRGYGNLFNRPSTPYRMEYKPHEIVDPYSRFGPAYFRRQYDQKCECIHGFCKSRGEHCEQCEGR